MMFRNFARSIKPVVKANLVRYPSMMASTPIKSIGYMGVRNYSNLKQVLNTELESTKSIPNELPNNYLDYINDKNIKVVTQEGISQIELIKTTDKEVILIYFDIDEITDLPIEPEFEEELEDDLAIDNYASNIKVLITKKDSPNSGIYANLLLQADTFIIDYINFKEDVSDFRNQAQKGEFFDKLKYQGPRFSELDESIQSSFENYLDNLGINNELADFVMAFSEFKEEEEYRKWLSDLTKFF